MKEMGFDIKEIRLYSIDNNKVYKIELPENDIEMLNKFEKIISDIRSFDIHTFVQNNRSKCEKCIYESACDRSLL